MFQKALKVVKGILGTASVISPILALFGVTIPAAAITAIPAVISFMTAAEDALGDGTGPLKKKAVTEGMVAFSSAMATVSTGGQQETWKAITPDVISNTIDGVASVANAIAKASGGNIVFDDTVFENMKMGL